MQPLQKASLDPEVISRTEVERMYEDLKLEIAKNKIDRNINIEQLDLSQEVLFNNMADIFWNKIYYVNSFTTTSVTTSSSSETLTARESDTSAGVYLRPERESKFKCTFYLFSGQLNSTVYITSPAVSTVTTAPTAMQTTTNSYAGIKIVATKVYLVSYTRGDSTETLKNTGLVIDDATTHLLEITYRPGESSDVYLDNVYLGTVKNNLVKDSLIGTFFPYLTSIKSSSGSVNLTIESYEFLQSRT